MPITEEDGWKKNLDTPGFHRAVSFDSPIGMCILNDLAKRFPQFKPKYIGQDYVHDGMPTMIGAYAHGPDDDGKVSTNPQDLYDIACVIYTLAGDVMTFFRASTNFDYWTMPLPQIRPDLREFYDFYQQLKQTAPEVITVIENFATYFETKQATYNGVYEPLALRELLWNFSRFLIGDTNTSTST